MTREEATICKAYLNDLDRTHDCNEYKLLMKLLDQEPSGDCVSRQAALDMATTIQTDDYGGNEIMEVVDVDDIKALPSVTPTQNWIPVSEKLPESQENDDEDFSDWLQITVKSDIQDQQMYVTEGYYCFSEQKWYIKRCLVGEVIAWKLLPKPYKEEMEGKE